MAKPKRITNKVKKIAKKSAKDKALKDKTLKEVSKDDSNLPAIPDIKIPPILNNNELKIDKRHLYHNPADMEIKINEYFQDVSNQPYHIAGLRLALGIYNVDTYKLYSQSRDVHYVQFNDLLKAAEHIIESGLVDQLFSARRYGAVIFYLKSKMGYVEAVDHQVNVSGSVNIRFTAETPEERVKRIESKQAKQPQVIDVTPDSVKKVS